VKVILHDAKEVEDDPRAGDLIIRFKDIGNRDRWVETVDAIIEARKERRRLWDFIWDLVAIWRAGR